MIEATGTEIEAVGELDSPAARQLRDRRRSYLTLNAPSPIERLVRESEAAEGWADPNPTGGIPVLQGGEDVNLGSCARSRSARRKYPVRRRRRA